MEIDYMLINDFVTEDGIMKWMNNLKNDAYMIYNEYLNSTTYYHNGSLH